MLYVFWEMVGKLPSKQKITIQIALEKTFISYSETEMR